MLQPSSHHIADSQMVHPEGIQDEKTQDTGLRELKYTSQERFQ